MPVPTTFGALTTPPGATGTELDNCIAFAANLGTLPTTIAGTNALTLTLSSTAPTVAAYFNYARFSGVAAADNAAEVTAQVGALAPLNVYKDSINGPVVLSGGEIQAGSLIILTYDSALNAGSGGFHLQTGSAALKGQTINPGALVFGGASGTLSASAATLSAMLTRTATVTFSVTPSLTSNDVIATLPGVSLGDTIMVTPYSPSPIAGAGYAGYFAAAGSLSVRQFNMTAASLAATTVILQLAALRIG